MSAPINTGGPAFPSKNVVNRFATEETAQKLIGADGMTLRDYFAAQALTPMILMEGRDYYSSHAFSYAKAAYHLADAMLAAREHTEGAQ